MATMQIRISGMTCQHCVQAVQKALSAVPGVEAVEVRLAPAQATVRGEAELARLLQAIEREGYRGFAA
jgi:copper chaperone